MQLLSPAFKNQGEIPSKYTCEGEDMSPPLEIKDIPPQTKSLVLIMDDPDAVKPAGKVWDHWIVYNISPMMTTLAEGAPLGGTLGQGTRKQGYQGPCPPDGLHHYHFKLYALDTLLKLPPGATKDIIEKEMHGHILAKTELMG